MTIRINTGVWASGGVGAWLIIPYELSVVGFHSGAAMASWNLERDKMCEIVVGHEGPGEYVMTCRLPLEMPETFPSDRCEVYVMWDIMEIYIYIYIYINSCSMGVWRP